MGERWDHAEVTASEAETMIHDGWEELGAGTDRYGRPFIRVHRCVVVPDPPNGPAAETWIGPLGLPCSAEVPSSRVTPDRHGPWWAEVAGVRQVLMVREKYEGSLHFSPYPGHHYRVDHPDVSGPNRPGPHVVWLAPVATVEEVEALRVRVANLETLTRAAIAAVGSGSIDSLTTPEIEALILRVIETIRPGGV
jgi:hypothetical protein